MWASQKLILQAHSPGPSEESAMALHSHLLLLALETQGQRTRNSTCKRCDGFQTPDMVLLHPCPNLPSYETTKHQHFMDVLVTPNWDAAPTSGQALGCLQQCAGKRQKSRHAYRCPGLHFTSVNFEASSAMPQYEPRGATQTSPELAVQVFETNLQERTPLACLDVIQRVNANR